MPGTTTSVDEEIPTSSSSELYSKSVCRLTSTIFLKIDRLASVDVAVEEDRLSEPTETFSLLDDLCSFFLCEELLLLELDERDLGLGDLERRKERGNLAGLGDLDNLEERDPLSRLGLYEGEKDLSLFLNKTGDGDLE